MVIDCGRLARMSTSASASNGSSTVTLARDERASGQAGEALAAQDARLGAARWQLVRQAGEKPAKQRPGQRLPPLWSSASRAPSGQHAERE